MNHILDILESERKKKLPDLRPGDLIKVHQKIREGGKERVAIFEGRVIAMRGGKGLNGTFTVRKIAEGVGVEKTFPWYLPTLVKIERLKSAKVKRAKLYYLREFQAKKLKRLKERKAASVWEKMIPELPLKETEEAKKEEVVREPEKELTKEETTKQEEIESEEKKGGNSQETNRSEG